MYRVGSDRENYFDPHSIRVNPITVVFNFVGLVKTMWPMHNLLRLVLLVKINLVS